MIRFYVSGNAIHDRCILSLFDGCPEEKRVDHIRDYRPSDVAVIFGSYKRVIPASWPRGVVLRAQRERGRKTVIIDSGYVRRGDDTASYYSVGINGLNGRANFRNDTMPGDRWEALGVDLKPWRHDGRHILVCGQVPWDAAVQHVDINAWCAEAVAQIKRQTNTPIIYRPHPKALGASPPIPGTAFSEAALQSDLVNCQAVITFNSNAAVDALIDGVPVFAFDRGSMAHPIANENWLDLTNPICPGRSQWAADLAYCQWTQNEMENGRTWAHLFRRHA